MVNSQTKESGNIEEMGRNLRKSVSLHLNNNNENSAVTKALSNPKLLDESLKQPLQVNIYIFFFNSRSCSTLRLENHVILTK